MSVKVRALRPLSEWIGNSRVEMEWRGGTLRDLIRGLVERYGPDVEQELKGENDSLDYVVSINGKIRRDLSTPIHDGDEVFFFTPIGGG